jgi:hypothetical protein
MATVSMPLFPLNAVLFPGGVLRLQVFEVRYLDMVQRCISQDLSFGVVLLTQGGEVRKPEVTEQFMPGGTMAIIDQTMSNTPGLLHLNCRGGARFRVVDTALRPGGLWWAEAELLEPDQRVPIPSELQGAADALERVFAALDEVPRDRWPLLPPFELDDCGWVANRWCDLLPLPNPQKHSLLMLDNPLIRLELLHDMLDEHGLLTS